jgi:site-specific recombinase XerD
MQSRLSTLPIFKDGVFTNTVKDFIYFKRACGLKYEDSAPYVLREICNQLNELPIGYPILTQEMVFKIVEKRPNESYTTQARRITYVRELGKYMNDKGYRAYIYPEQSIHKESKTFIPYIFTDEEIQNIFQVVDSLPKNSRYPYYHVVYPVLIRILYSCGLRVSEALMLKIKHYNASEETILIKKSINRSRIVPLSQSMSHVLLRYLTNRYGSNPDAERYIFETHDGNHYSRHTVLSVVRKVFKKAGIPVEITVHHPNVHSFRHNHAVTAMEKMQRDGMDLYCMLPLLSCFLGHKGVRETERYLRLPQFRLAEIADAGRHLINHVIPEVPCGEE